MKKELLIIGIDPGTTTAYAALDTRGRVVEISSSRSFSLSAIITRLIRLGMPAVIASDKRSAPMFVEKLSARLGSRLMLPKEDMPVMVKKGLVKGHKFKGDHERDALASSLYAFRKLKALIKKTDIILEKEKKASLRGDVLKLLLLQDGISIRLAIDITENTAKKHEARETSIIRQAIEKKSATPELINLYERFRRLKRENALLRGMHERHQKEMQSLRDRADHLNRKIERFSPEKKAMHLLEKREERIKGMESENNRHKKLADDLRDEISLLNSMLSSLSSSGHVIAKRLFNLGSKEYNSKSKALNLSPGDLLLVDDASIISENAVKKMSGIVGAILCSGKKPKPKFLEKHFTIINSDDVKMVKSRYFVSIDKKSLDNARKKANIIEKIVEEYKGNG